MNLSLVVLAAWLSAVMAPIEPVVPKASTPALGPVLQPAGKLPQLSKPPKLSWRPGSYSLDSLKLPPVMAMEKLDVWQPAWPYVEDAVVVVTDNAQDPQRFMAFLVDVRAQKVVAVRDGDQARHLPTIGQMRPDGAGKDPQALPPGIMQLAGSGAVIILRPPQPPGPGGIPNDLVAKILDAAALASQAGEWVNAGKPGGLG